MTTPGRYAAPDGSFAKSTGNAAARGGGLILVALVIGFLLLWKGGIGSDGDAGLVDSGADSTGEASDSSDDADGAATDGDDSDQDADDDGAATDGDTGDDSDVEGDDTTTDTTPEVTGTRPVNEVKVVVANGEGTPGLAGSRAEVLSTAGYVIQAENAAVIPTEASVVYYVQGYDQEALGVAAELGGDASVVLPAPADPLALVVDATEVADFAIWVILGSDRVLG